jgi:hypothetical protein
MIKAAIGTNAGRTSNLCDFQINQEKYQSKSSGRHCDRSIGTEMLA